MRSTEPKHFKRAMAMFAAIAQIFTLHTNIAAQQAALASIGPYRSRGHGQGKGATSHYCAAMQKRESIKAKNRAKHRAACRVRGET
jgi:hypothetical protein